MTAPDPQHSDIDLRALRYFNSVGRTGNIGRAARELQLSQPAISGQIQKLEKTFGTSLFVRHPKGVTLTAAGVRLMRRIDAIMGLLDAPLPTDAETDERVGELSLAMPPEIAPIVAPRLIAACAARWPRLSLAVREGQSATLEEWLLEGASSIAILQDPPPIGGLRTWPVVNESLGLVTDVRTEIDPPNRRLGIRDLAGASLILPGWRHWIRRVVEAAAFQRGAKFTQIRESESIASTKGMVRAGLGWAILPYVAVQDDAARGALTFWPIERDRLATVHAISVRPGAEQMPFVPELCDTLMTIMRDVVTDGTWGQVTSVPGEAPPLLPPIDGAMPSAAAIEDNLAAQ
jgi:LysR family transcriptional regulator, nitrogen assimilation regulatory protein